MRYGVQAESRFGLKPVVGRLITACGVKPVGPWRWLFRTFWLYGAVGPATGEAFFLQFSHVDTVCYQRFLDELSQTYPESLNIVQVDNGRFHKGEDLVVPENIVLLFQPPYCPEVNPIERLWQHLKADLKCATFKTLNPLQTHRNQRLSELTPQVIASITGYAFILDALNTV